MTKSQPKRKRKLIEFFSLPFLFSRRGDRKEESNTSKGVSLQRSGRRDGGKKGRGLVGRVRRKVKRKGEGN